MMTWAGVKVLPLTPCRAKNNGEGYYFAADGRGIFPFLISPSKITSLHLAKQFFGLRTEAMKQPI